MGKIARKASAKAPAKPPATPLSSWFARSKRLPDHVPEDFVQDRCPSSFSWPAVSGSPCAAKGSGHFDTDEAADSIFPTFQDTAEVEGSLLSAPGQETMAGAELCGTVFFPLGSTQALETGELPARINREETGELPGWMHGEETGELPGRIHGEKTGDLLAEGTHKETKGVDVGELPTDGEEDGEPDKHNSMPKDGTEEEAAGELDKDKEEDEQASYMFS